MHDGVVDSQFEVVERPQQQRFELLRDGELVGFVEYQQIENSVVIPHVETVVEYRGQGYGDRTMAGVLELIRQSNRTVHPVCPFAARFLAQHPDQHDLLTG